MTLYVLDTDTFTLYRRGDPTVTQRVEAVPPDQLAITIITIEGPVHVHDLNAMVLRSLGIGHKRLTFKFQGRDIRLTDVHGNVVGGLLA
jgi:hypothetical protein